jgi:hypothetical protein
LLYFDPAWKIKGQIPILKIVALLKIRGSLVSPPCRALWCIGLAIVISACQPEPVDKADSQDLQDAQAEIAVAKDTPDPHSKLLDDGFYGQTNTESDNEGNEDRLALEDSNIEINRPTEDQTDSVKDDALVTPDGLNQNTDIETANKFYCLGDDLPSIEDNQISTAQACKRISSRLASVSESDCSSAKLEPSHCQAVSGFPILIREFPPLPDKQPQGRILVVGGTHGDELTSVSITFMWIEKLNRYHSGLFHWHVVPMMNPDGVLSRGATRTNKNGVDLNRNMPSDDWQVNALKYWERETGKNPRRYPGEKPASEPETQWLIDEINLFKPDVIIAVHAPYGVVDFDSLLLNTAPKNLGKLHLNLLGTFPGSLGNYAGIDRNIPVITLELPHAWEMPSDTEVTKIWEDIVSWLRKNVPANVVQNTRVQETGIQENPGDRLIKQ